MMIDAVIRPGKPWLDTNGNRIQAHGGSVHFEAGVFYWYGENKERTAADNNIWHWGVRCYSSTDLANWEDRGLIIPPDVDDPESPLHPAQSMDRPHIVYNPTTLQYVCWIKVMGDGQRQASTILTADNFLGPYEIQRTGLRPLGMNAGDFDLTVNPTDGKAYYYYERVHSELICADLTEDFLDVTGYYSTHFPHPAPPSVREAPAHFVRQGKHYLITSGTTAYFPNPSEVAVADSYHGPWTVLGDPHPLDVTRTSYQSQISCIFKHPNKRDLYIAVADRWLPTVPADRSNVEPLFQRMFAGERPEDVFADAPGELLHPDTSIADYVWLPLRFEGDMVFIDWRDEWRVDDFE